MGKISFDQVTNKRTKATDASPDLPDASADRPDAIEKLSVPELYMAPDVLGDLGVDSRVRMNLRSQKARKELLDLLTLPEGNKDAVAPKPTLNGYPMRYEWCIERTKLGEYYLIVRYKVKTSPPIGSTIDLKGDLLVRSCDPGVRNPLSVYSSDGMTIDLGDAGDSQRLKELLLKADQLKSRRTAKKPNVGKEDARNGKTSDMGDKKDAMDSNSDMDDQKAGTDDQKAGTDDQKAGTDSKTGIEANHNKGEDSDKKKDGTKQDEPFVLTKSSAAVS